LPTGTCESVGDWKINGNIGVLVRAAVRVGKVGVSLNQRLDHAVFIGTTGDERLTLITCWPYRVDDHRLTIITRPD